MVIFVSVVLGIWSFMHLFVAWRLWGVPGIASAWGRRSLVITLVVLWLSYPLGRVFARLWPSSGTAPFEFVGAFWLGILFLLFVALLTVDAATLFGRLLPALAPTIRLWALAVVGVLSIVGLVQALRPPEVVEYEVSIEALPPELDGTVIVQISDLHLGTLLGRGWLTDLIPRIESLQPDLIAVTGDLVDSHPGNLKELQPILRGLKAPMGVWAVTGNHEFYAGLKESAAFMEKAGFHLLRDQWEEAAPGLILAGVDDLTARRQFQVPDHPLAKALGGRPPGATVLLSHSPMEANRCAAMGVDLMLSGHTHGGQIWPFGWAVRLAYKYISGCYRVGEMTLIVSRGAGTWGPRMRLFGRSEIGRIVLKSTKPDTG